MKNPLTITIARGFFESITVFYFFRDQPVFKPITK
ncbi:MAG: hypothetical protein BWX49_00541 [Bacteroidetes bacterium ADurb.Bin008]|nr:MAG: hypothetical protein BWX49_00541 [Bacteroidetes bacterium ADurb.Bin008]